MKFKSNRQKKILQIMVKQIKIKGKDIDKFYKFKKSIENAEIGKQIELDNEEQKANILAIINSFPIPGHLIDDIYEIKKQILSQ